MPTEREMARSSTVINRKQTTCQLGMSFVFDGTDGITRRTRSSYVVGGVVGSRRKGRTRTHTPCGVSVRVQLTEGGADNGQT